VLVQFPERKIVAAVKASTTQDVHSGVINAIRGLLEFRKDVDKSQIKAVMLGTTAFVNAFVELSDELSKVAVIRLCQPATTILPPFVDWPKNIRDRIRLDHCLVNGGY
jgi:N-methylhydantoinase A/oxoprolinase/acetone carboxylase beta subunit